MIDLQHVGKQYRIGGELFKAIDDITFSINKGDYLSILGPSGSGKSTLMHIIGLLDKPSTGTVRIDDRDVSKRTDDELSQLRNEFVGFVFQQFNLINKLTNLENIILPTVYTRKKLDFDPKTRAIDLLARFGLQGKEHSFPNKISGGQQQRIAIARALIMKPKLILADEPTGNLDTKNGNAIMDLLEELNAQQGVTLVVITHETDIANRTKRRVVIQDGTMVRP
jgi:putative ABC transport system ATP-binding protein